MSIPSRQLFKNATLTVIQVTVSATVMFVVYKYLLNTIGAEQVGIWSIVMAVSTVTRIADLGFAGGMTRFVAKYQALEQPDVVVQVVETAFVSLAIFSALIALIAYPLLVHFLPVLMDPNARESAFSLVPYSLASFSLVALAGVLLSTLDGLIRTDLRNITLTAGTVAFGFLVPLLVSLFGLVGLGMAQLLQSAGVLLVAALLVRRRIGLRFFRIRWNYSRFREMLGYNVNLQITSAAALLGDPLAKILIGHFGNLALVGYFEMASKLVGQFRAVATNVTQILVPVVTQLHETGAVGLDKLYRDTYRVLFYVCAYFYAASVLALPLISVAWIGYFHPFFVQISCLMIFAMFLNTLSGPAYFFNLGTGHARENTMAQLIIGGMNGLGGVGLGSAYGGVGASVAYALAIVIGSAFLVLRFLRMHHFPLKYLLPGRSALASSMGLVVSFSGAGLSFTLNGNLEYLSLALALGILVFIIGWKNPERLYLSAILRRRGRSQDDFG